MTEHNCVYGSDSAMRYAILRVSCSATGSSWPGRVRSAVFSTSVFASSAGLERRHQDWLQALYLTHLSRIVHSLEVDSTML